jgi:hypothetical protein
MREEVRLRVSENMVLRRIFGLKRDEVTREWRKLHNESLAQYCAGDKIEKNEMGRACSAYGEGRGVYRILVAKPVGKNHWGDLGVDWRIILKWIFRTWAVKVWTGLRWIRIDRWRTMVNAVMKLWVS